MDTETLYCTVTFPRRANNILLGRKTEKVGVGLFNGPGGVIHRERREEPYGATVRELYEETSLRANVWDVVPLAIIDCHNKKDDGTPWLCKIFVSEIYTWCGKHQNSRELVDQQWFPTTTLPLSEMLPGDQSWMPLAFSGERFKADVYYGPGLKTLERDTVITPLSKPELIRLWRLP